MCHNVDGASAEQEWNRDEDWRVPEGDLAGGA